MIKIVDDVASLSLSTCFAQPPTLLSLHQLTDAQPPNLTAFCGDTVTLTASRKELRARFDETRRSSGALGAQEIDQALADAAEAADFLRTFVVQAKLNERGNYEMKLESHHADTVAEEAAIRGSRSKKE